jgi:hypothetical protein
MKKNLFKFPGVLVCSALLFVACSEGKDSSDAEINYQVEPVNLTASIGPGLSESGLVVDINSNSSLTWKAGYVTIARLDFEAKKEDKEIEYKISKPVTVDFFNASHEFGNVDIAPGTYKEVGLELVLKKQITGNVFAISGDYVNELGKSTPVEFNYNEDLTFSSETEDLTVSASTDYTGLLILELNKLLTETSSSDFRSATKDASGKIVISSTSNIELFNKIKTAIASVVKAEFKS